MTVQHQRFGRDSLKLNGRMSSRQIRQPLVSSTLAARRSSKSAVENSRPPPPAPHDRILRVARTIADLDGQFTIAPNHVTEALNYRILDRILWMQG